PALMPLFDEALRANLLRVRTAGIELESLRAEAPLLRKRAVEAEDRIEASEAKAAEADTARGQTERRVSTRGKGHRYEKTLLERQLAETRQELAGIQTSRLWKLANLYWITRRKAGGLLPGGRGGGPAGGGGAAGGGG